METRPVIELGHMNTRLVTKLWSLDTRRFSKLDKNNSHLKSAAPVKKGVLYLHARSCVECLYDSYDSFQKPETQAPSWRQQTAFPILAPELLKLHFSRFHKERNHLTIFIISPLPTKHPSFYIQLRISQRIFKKKIPMLYSPTRHGCTCMDWPAIGTTCRLHGPLLTGGVLGEIRLAAGSWRLIYSSSCLMLFMLRSWGKAIHSVSVSSSSATVGSYASAAYWDIT